MVLVLPLVGEVMVEGEVLMASCGFPQQVRWG